MTFNGNLPIDVIEISVVDKDETVKPIDFQLDIVCNRYFKSHPDKSTEFKTRLVSQKGVYSHVNTSQEELTIMLETAGLIAHKNCIPHVANNKATCKSKVRALLHLVDTPAITLPTIRGSTGNRQAADVDLQLDREIQQIEFVKKPIFEKLTACKEKIATIDKFVASFKESKPTTLIKLFQKEYSVTAARRHGSRYKMLLEDGGRKLNVWTNWYLGQQFDSFVKRGDVKDTLYDPESGYILSLHEELAVLTVRGRAVNEWGNWTVYTSIKFNDPLKSTDGGYNTRSKTLQTADTLQDSLAGPSSAYSSMILGGIPVKDRKDLLHYPLNPILSSLPPLSVKTVSSIGWVSFRGKDRLLIELDGTMYGAGTDVESKVGQIKNGSSIRIEKNKIIRSSRQLEAICTIIQPGEWFKLVNYIDYTLYNTTSTTENIRVLDVKEALVKGSKRKLALTDKGVYRFNKKSKLESNVRAGDLL